MNQVTAAGRFVHQGLTIARSSTVGLAVFAATLFASALLLFSVQPMFARMALPALGGTPAVWAISMCFFQVVLFLGYCYAHALNRWTSPKLAIAIHLGLMGCALLALPIGLPPLAGNPPEGDAYGWLLGVLALGVGLPFFAVSANAPLLQSWFAQTGHAAAKDPYFLYGASNFGSLLALLAYPFVLEPALGLQAQSYSWSIGFLALMSCVAICGGVMLATRRTHATGSDITADQQAATIPQPQITTLDQLRWLALAAIPSGLMVSITTYITTDIASAPFIWVMPLAAFLLTFIIMFRDKIALPYDVLTASLPIIVMIHFMSVVKIGNWSETLGFLGAIFGFLVATLICHRELYLRRPSAKHLTKYYLVMSAGGMVGGLFAALLAPQIFSTVVEFKFLLVLSLFAIPNLIGSISKEAMQKAALAVTAIIGACFALAALAPDIFAILQSRLMIILICGIACAPLLKFVRSTVLASAIAVTALLLVIPSHSNESFEGRSFFGVLRAGASGDGLFSQMAHGTTMHGAQRRFTDAGVPVTTPIPAAYYYAGSPMAEGIITARSFAERNGRPLSAGIVGLGAGSLACYSQPNEAWRFYEIDPMVAKVARDPKYFSFLSDCLPNNDIVFGDARLTLQNEPASKFDYLLIDAFSSDAIPVHLLTREAMTMYASKLNADGVLTIHISNRHLELESSIGATVAEIAGLQGIAVVARRDIESLDAMTSHVIYISRSADILANLKSKWLSARPLAANGVAAWTDDYSDIVSAMFRRRATMK